MVDEHSRDLGHKLPVSEGVRIDDAGQRVAENMRVVPVVVAPLQFFQVAVHMLDAHLVEGPDDGTLEEAPHAFDAVGVHVTHNPFFGRVLDGLMAGVVIADPDVRLEIIGVDRFGFVSNGSGDEGMKGLPLHVGDALDTDVSPSLDGPGHPMLVPLVGTALALGFAADQSFVHFDDTDQSGAGQRIVAHRLADTVAEVPSRPVGYSDCPVQLVGAHALLGLAEQIDSGKPLAERQVRVMHDRAGLDAEMVAASDAVPLAPAFDRAHVHIAAPVHATPLGQRSASRCFRQVSSLAKRSSRETMSMNQTPKKKQKLPRVDVDDAKLAEKVFGKRLKKEIDRVAETAGRKGVTKFMHE